MGGFFVCFIMSCSYLWFLSLPLPRTCLKKETSMRTQTRVWPSWYSSGSDPCDDGVCPLGICKAVRSPAVFLTTHTEDYSKISKSAYVINHKHFYCFFNSLFFFFFNIPSPVMCPCSTVIKRSMTWKPKKWYLFLEINYIWCPLQIIRVCVINKLLKLLWPKAALDFNNPDEVPVCTYTGYKLRSIKGNKAGLGTPGDSHQESWTK